MFNRLLFKSYGHWLVSFLFWMVLILPAQALELRVAVKKNVSNLKVGSSTTAIVKDARGRKIGKINPMASLSASVEGQQINLDRLNGTEIIIEPEEDGYVWIGDGWYRGNTRLVLQGNSLTAINLVDLEQYLYSVVGAEAVSTWPIEALKAQAVAARSYALYKRKMEKNALYDVDTTQSTQVYKGLNSEYLTTHEAVNSTVGQILSYQGNVILAAFHSSSGGHTENVEDVWTKPLPYLRGVPDYDREAPVFEWNKVFTVSEIGNLVKGVGNIQSMIPEKLTPQGRVVTMKVIGDRGTIRVSGAKIRKVLGLRSTLFRVSRKGNEFQVYGRGYGHGLGLSQWGAYYLAKQGVKYNQILGHYYRNVALSLVK